MLQRRMRKHTVILHKLCTWHLRDFGQKPRQTVGCIYWRIWERTVNSGDRVVTSCLIRMIGKAHWNTQNIFYMLGVAVFVSSPGPVGLLLPHVVYSVSQLRRVTT